MPDSSSSRPRRSFWRKKRLLIPAAALVVGIAAVSCQGSNDSAAPPPPAPAATTQPVTSADAPSSTIAKGAASKDASADVTGVTLGDPDVIGFRDVAVSVTNNSSKPSDYIIAVAVESADGATQYGTATVVVQSLDPGQSTVAHGSVNSNNAPAGGLQPVVKTVQRTAA